MDIIKYLRFEGWKGNPTTIYRWLHNNRSGFFDGKPNPGTTPSFTAEHEQVIGETLRQTPNAVAADLRRVIETVTGRKFSLSTVRRHRRRLGWICTKPRYCQAISHTNKPLRLQWCKDRYGLDFFKDVIFTDESTIQMNSNSDYVFRKVGEPRPMAARHKHPYKVHVWAGISWKGATNIHIFTGIMKSEYYCTILGEHLLPFIEEKFPEGHRLQQDNCRIHTSRATTAFLEESHVEVMPFPAQSPDLNPIENVWAELKRWLRNIHKPQTKQELIDGIRLFWSTKMTPNKCRSYITHLQKVMSKVIEAKGRASGY